MTDQLSTIYQLLDASNTLYRVFDIGRRVQKLSQSEFQDFETTTMPYPYPLQKKAWLAILFWDKARSEQQYLWFLKFDLDEQGKLIQATRSHFVSMVMENLGTQLTGDNISQDKLNNNPYTFKPDQTKLAALNARIKIETRQPASVYYEHSQSYLSGALGWHDWQNVAVQGLADFATRINDGQNLPDLLNAWPHLPAQVKTSLCSLLEHVVIPTSLAELLSEQGLAALKSNDKTALLDSLRGLSHAKATKIRQQLLAKVLASELATDQHILLVITGRCWLDLQDDALRAAFLEKLASASEDQQLFQGIVADLVAIPAVRPYILQSFRNTDRSPTLATAIGHLFGQHQPASH